MECYAALHITVVVSKICLIGGRCLNPSVKMYLVSLKSTIPVLKPLPKRRGQPCESETLRQWDF